MSAMADAPPSARVRARPWICGTEVVAVLAAFWFVKGFIRTSGVGDWQGDVFGANVLTSILLFFVLPLPLMIFSGLGAGHFGLITSAFGRHAAVAGRAAMYIAPAGMLFPVMAFLGTNHRHWLGAAILSAGYGLGTLLFMWRSRRLEPPPASSPKRGYAVYAVVLAVSAVVCAGFFAVESVGARVVRVIVFVALLEEVFFRGYVQTRLNDAFGRSYRLFGVNVGWGLPIAAIVFGLAHPLTAPGPTPWPWAVWTTVGGVAFGFLRDKSGGVVAPAILHAVMILPTAFMAGS